MLNDVGILTYLTEQKIFIDYLCLVLILQKICLFCSGKITVSGENKAEES